MEAPALAGRRGGGFRDGRAPFGPEASSFAHSPPYMRGSGANRWCFAGESLPLARNPRYARVKCHRRCFGGERASRGGRLFGPEPPALRAAGGGQQAPAPFADLLSMPRASASQPPATPALSASHTTQL